MAPKVPGSSSDDGLRAFQLPPPAPVKPPGSPKAKGIAKPMVFGSPESFFVPRALTPSKSAYFRRRKAGNFDENNLKELRLLRRDAPSHQSGGHIYMHRTGAAVGLALNDFFHVALGMPLVLLLMVCMALYTTLILIWTGFYIAADHPGVACGIAPLGEHPNFYRAFAFSLETMTTIGYGLPRDDSDFWEENCISMLVVVYFEALFFIILNASIVGVLFARVGTADRACPPVSIRPSRSTNHTLAPSLLPSACRPRWLT